MLFALATFNCFLTLNLGSNKHSTTIFEHSILKKNYNMEYRSVRERAELQEDDNSNNVKDGCNATLASSMQTFITCKEAGLLEMLAIKIW